VLAKHTLEFGVVKALVKRQRPGTTVPGAILRDAHPTGLSFPSGHSILAFALAGLASPYLGWGVALHAVAALNGIARIYLGAHTPLDVVGGAGLGVAIGGSINLLFGVPAGG
jgi:undecaprenyl-diphosphatase